MSDFTNRVLHKEFRADNNIHNDKYLKRRCMLRIDLQLTKIVSKNRYVGIVWNYLVRENLVRRLHT